MDCIAPASVSAKNEDESNGTGRGGTVEMNALDAAGLLA
jgi:hypothetical protein